MFSSPKRYFTENICRVPLINAFYAKPVIWVYLKRIRMLFTYYSRRWKFNMDLADNTTRLNNRPARDHLIYS